MCRIFGACHLQGYYIDGIITDILQSNLVHGGPDEVGKIIVDSCVLGVNRLAIMDPENGKQPFKTTNVATVYSGEIYNHLELRQYLIEKGINFYTNCDGEILPHLYNMFGLDAFTKLDGMFACALWDRKNHRLILARDHAGMKPLYYTLMDGLLIFSSEIPALLALPNIDKSISPLAIDTYLSLKAVYTMNSPLGEETIFSGIWSVPPGTLLIWEPENGIYLHRFTSNPSQRAKLYSNLTEFETNLSSILEKEIIKLVQADVPICSIISGGLDSSIVSSLVAKHYREQLNTFTIGYTGVWESDERQYAQEVADFLGTKHHEIELNPDDIPEILPKVIYHLGQPNADPITVSSYALFEAISNYGFKVAISGDGSDEIFGGYDRLKEFVLNSYDSPSVKFNKYWNSLAAISIDIRNELYSKSFKYYLNEVQSKRYFKEEMICKLNSTSKEEQLDILLNFEVNYRLPVYHLQRVDHLSSAHGSEVRVPFCQKDIVDFAFSLSSDKKIRDDGKVKAILSDTANSYNWIPKSIIDRKKQPFTLPINQMLNPTFKLGKFAKEILLDDTVRKRGYFNFEKIESLIRALSTTNVNNEIALTIWSLLVLAD